MHTLLKSVKFPSKCVLSQCPSIIRYQGTNVQKGDCKNSCSEKNVFESNVSRTCCGTEIWTFEKETVKTAVLRKMCFKVMFCTCVVIRRYEHSKKRLKTVVSRKMLSKVMSCTCVVSWNFPLKMTLQTTIRVCII